ncbi:MAG: hypothetical protein ISS78_07160, partial [Phycisphaerae bacterium]|nr:hypothetical protein [Phycisphaerae bacterium]
MRRTIPLWITAVCGFVLIVAHFSPYTESWGEATMIWFDVLASVAFILGGGNLLKIHLKKISDRAAGWAYSAITILAFVVTLYVGLVKWGAPPAQQQECYGEAFARLPLADFPVTYSVEGTIPEKSVGAPLPPSVRRQLRGSPEKPPLPLGEGWGEGGLAKRRKHPHPNPPPEGEGTLANPLPEGEGTLDFHGWMAPDQKRDLADYQEQLRWKCAVLRLSKAAQPPGPLAGKVAYHVDHEVLAFTGHMTEADRDALLALGQSEAWRQAVEALYEKTQRVAEVSVTFVPPGFDAEKAKAISDAVRFDPQRMVLGVQGPMSADRRDALCRQFPLGRPLPEGGPGREALLAELTARGPLSQEQIEAFHLALNGAWSVEELVKVLNVAGLGEEVPKTACEMFQEQQRGARNIQPKKPKGKDQQLSRVQVAIIEQFASGDVLTAERLHEELIDGPATLAGSLEAAAAVELAAELAPGAPGPGDARAGLLASASRTLRGLYTLNDKQAAALDTFFEKTPSRRQRNKDLGVAMMKKGPLTREQSDWLLDDYRQQLAWQRSVGELFLEAQKETFHEDCEYKFPWSGEYRAAGTPFWWLYEYAFKPLTATMFAMLAFYVASAAFRAFRAKNVEATLLLVTAFIILLGRTFAGALLTGWLPDWLYPLRIENLTDTIMAVFNTAGTRAIFIGIALGIASISLKVLLGI